MCTQMKRVVMQNKIGRAKLATVDLAQKHAERPSTAMLCMCKRACLDTVLRSTASFSSNLGRLLDTTVRDGKTLTVGVVAPFSRDSLGAPGTSPLARG